MESTNNTAAPMILAMLELQLSDWQFLTDRLAQANAPAEQVRFCKVQASQLTDTIKTARQELQ